MPIIHFSLDKVQERIEADQNILSEELSIQLDEADSINKEMAKLKVRMTGVEVAFRFITPICSFSIQGSFVWKVWKYHQFGKRITCYIKSVWFTLP